MEAKLTSVQRNSANFINLANYSFLSLENLISHTIYKGLSPYPEKFCKFLQLYVRDHEYHSHLRLRRLCRSNQLTEEMEEEFRILEVVITPLFQDDRKN